MKPVLRLIFLVSLCNVFNGMALAANFSKSTIGHIWIDAIQNPSHHLIKGERIPYEVIKKDNVPTENHTSIDVVYDEKEFKIRLSYDAVAEANPALLLRDVVLFDHWRTSNGVNLEGIDQKQVGLYKEFSTTAPGVTELYGDMKNGSKTAHIRWLRWQQATLENIIVDDELEQSVPGLRNEISKQKKNITEKISSLVSDLNSIKTVPVLINLDQLNQRVATNDRTGVAELFRQSLPWPEMQPSETKAWMAWLEAIEKPDLQNTTWAFRGMNGNVNAALFATTLSINFSKHKVYSNEIFKARQTVGDLESQNAKLNQNENLVRISDQLYAHAEAINSNSSNFISFSPDISVAEQFVGGSNNFPGPKGSIIAVRIDSRRFIANLNSDYSKELELLAPLVIFPDEIMVLKKNYGGTEAERKAFLKEVKSKGAPDQLFDPDTYWWQLKDNALNFYRYISS